MKQLFGWGLPLALALHSPLSAATPTLFHNGNIITLAEPAQAEALLINEGKITALGSYQQLAKNCQQACKRVDLKGRTLLPGFIDAHGHYTMTLDYLGYRNVASPPVGPANKIEDILAELKQQASARPDEQWILGAGYDDSLLAEKRHPTRWELDQVSKDKPVFIRHVSGHLGVCNSRCLELAHIDKNTPNPEGGVFRRKPDTNIPNGVMEESALHNVTHVIPSPSLQQQLERLTELDRYYAQYGITTVQDGATSSKGLALLQAAAKGKHLSLDVIAYPYYAWTDLDKFLPSSGPGKDYNNGFRIAGVKLVLDGSPQGKTAWLSHPYHEPPKGLPKDYKGYPILKDEQLKETLGGFYSKGYQILAHANGDAAAEQMLRIMDKLKAEQKHQPRSVMIHAQTVRDDQLDRMAALDIIPSFFVAHTFYWGDWHRDSVLGQSRASRISPLRSASEKNIRYTIHNDTPIVPPDMPLLLWTATQRQTRSGQTLGKAQQATALEALKAITIDAAYQHFEEDRKGSLAVGKLADLVIVDRNPLTMPSAELKDLKVLQTIKEGQVVYQNPVN